MHDNVSSETETDKNRNEWKWFTHEMRISGGKGDGIGSPGFSTMKFEFAPRRDARRTVARRLNQLHFYILRCKLHLRSTK